MSYFATLFIILAMVWATSIVGRRVCDLASFRLAPVYRLYFSPLFGLALFALIFTIHGWLVPFRTGSSIAIVGGLVLASLYFEKERRVLLRYLAALALFSLIASSPVLFPLLRFDAYNPFNDTFTYLVHGQWLQSHAFLESALPTGEHPALTQVALYQRAGLRMGASFMLGWTQSVFGLEWSYYAFPAIVSVPLVAGALAAGGAVKLIVRRQRLVSILAALSMATVLSGFSYGALSGFFPQTFGLAFAVGGATLLAAVLVEGLRTTALRTTVLNSFPAALVFAALVLTYNDMLAFVGAGAVVSLCFLLKGSERKKRILTVLMVLFAEVAVLVNFELIRGIRNFVGVLMSVGSGVAVIGWPVLWSPAEFLAFALGFRSPLDAWLFGARGLTLPAAIVVALAMLWFAAVNVARGKKLSAYVAMHLGVLLSMAAGFVYFRYFGKDPTPAEAGIGYTFLQFKLAKWASPFCLVLMGATFAHLNARAKGRYSLLAPAFFAVLIASGVAANYRLAAATTTNFLQEAGYQRSAFSALLHLRELTHRVPPDDVIYLNLGTEHPKLRQMVAYVLHDKKLTADWTGDNYIGYHLAPDQRNTSARAAAWVIDFADAARPLSDPTAGSLVLRRMPRYFATIGSVTGAHGRETDGANWWNWVANSVTYTYRIRGKPTRLKFSFRSVAQGSKDLKVIVKGKEVAEFLVKGGDGWNEYTSPPLEVGEGPELSVTIAAEGKPIRISPADARMASFLLQNLEVLQEDAAGKK